MLHCVQVSHTDVGWAAAEQFLLYIQKEASSDHYVLFYRLFTVNISVKVTLTLSNPNPKVFESNRKPR